MWIEILGIAATVIILISFAQNGEKRIRFINLIGAGLFTYYGILSGAFSVILLNSALVALQIYKLWKLSKKK